MFLLCGVGLLVVARFWMHRKQVLLLSLWERVGGEGCTKATVVGSDVRPRTPSP